MDIQVTVQGQKIVIKNAGFKRYDLNPFRRAVRSLVAEGRLSGEFRGMARTSHWIHGSRMDLKSIYHISSHGVVTKSSLKGVVAYAKWLNEEFGAEVEQELKNDL